MASPPEDGGAERALAPSAGGAVFSPVSPAQAQAAALEAQLVQPTLFSYVANDLVWARASAKATDPFWPGRMIDVLEAPEGVRRECVANAVCVQFYGPSASKSRDRDYCWADAARLAPYPENKDVLTNQHVPKRLRPSAFREACEEAETLFKEHGNNVSAAHADDAMLGDLEIGALDRDETLDTDERARLVSDEPRCESCLLPLEPSLQKSCGVKGSGRCRLCAKLHKQGQFCPCCEKVWQWANCPAMVGCDLCDFWVHASCDAEAARVMSLPEDGPEVSYHCPKCREKTAKEAEKKAEKEAKEAEKAAKKERLKAEKAEKARAERAEKKAAADAEKAARAARERMAHPHGQTLEHDAMRHVKFEGFDDANLEALGTGFDGGDGGSIPFGSGPERKRGDGVIGGASSAPRGLDLSRAPPLIRHKKAPGGVPRRPKSAWQIFGSDFFKQYREAHKNDEGGVNFAEVYKFQGQAWRDLPDSERAVYEARARVEAEKFRLMIKSLQDQGVVKTKQNKKKNGNNGPSGPSSKAGGGGGDSDDGDDGATDLGGGVTRRADGTLLGPDGRPLSKQEKKAFESGYQPRVDRRASHWSQHFKAEEILKRPDKVGVVCNGVRADFHIKEFRMLCQCSQCLGAGKSMSATEFEKHAGMGQAKKWKASIRMIEPARMPIGRWLDGGANTNRAEGNRKANAGERSGRNRRGGAGDLAGDRRKALGYKLVRVKWTVDRCAVCDDDRDFDFDQLVTCEGCGISVHQSCYGIPEIPDDAIGYLCAACEHTGGVVSETPLCALCPVEGGALKPTTTNGQWCHSACCQWIPETTVLDVDRMEPIDQIKTIQRERWELLCTVCKQRMGAKIQCASPGCYLAYHPLCARAAGLFMEASLDDEDAEDPDADAPLVMVSYCHRHCRVDVERAKAWAGEESASGAGPGAEKNAEKKNVSDEPAAADKLSEDKKLSKAERKLLALEQKKREEEELLKRRARDDALDAPEDDIGAARCRPYDASLYKGHPRTEAGEETIVADTRAIRRALQHGMGGGVLEGQRLRRDGRKRREREAWVQCETCSKWRRVRQSVAEAFARADAGQWTCAISEHPRVNSCDVPQELLDDDIDERVALGDKCPFYDDDDLDPPEVIQEEKDGEDGDEEDEDDDEDEDEDEDEDDSDSDGSDPLLEDAPPGGWTDPAAFAPIRDQALAASGDDAVFDADADRCETDDKRKRSPDEEPAEPEPKRARARSEDPASAPAVPAEPAAAARTSEAEPGPSEAPGDEAFRNASEETSERPERDAVDVPPEPVSSPAAAGPPVNPKPEPRPDPLPAAPLSDLPDVKVLCKYLEGVFRPRDNMIRCFCTRCKKETLWEPNRWEGHAGMRQAKKWKTSVRVVDPKDQLDNAAKEEARADYTRRVDSGEEDVEPVPDEIETPLGDWLDRNGLVLEVVPAPRKGAKKKDAGGGEDDGKPQTKKPKREREDADARRRRTGRAALAGLAIDLDVDLNKAADDVEARAAALVGRAVRLNPNAGPNGAPLILGGPPNKKPRWLKGVVVDVKMSRGGCRHLVAFEEEDERLSGDDNENENENEGEKIKGEDWFTLNRCEVRFIGESGEGDDDGDAPDLSFLPVAAPVTSTRRGMGGMAAMFARSAAAPAPLGRLFKKASQAPNTGEDGGEGKNDEDDEDEDEAHLARAGDVVAAEAMEAPNASADIAAAAGAPDASVGALGAGPSEEDPLPKPEENSKEPQMIAPLPENGLVGVLPDDLPSVVTVVCKQTAGDYFPRTGLITCLCSLCSDAKAANEDSNVFTMDPNRWEMHCGMGQAKKWKASVRVLLENHRTMPVGKWLTGFGVAVSAPRAPRRDAKFGPKRNKLKKMKKNGLLDPEEAMYRKLEPMGRRNYGDGRISGDAARGPIKISGKRTFVELVPYVVRGAKLRSRGGNNRGGFARRGFGGDERDEKDLAMDGENSTIDPAVAEGASLPIESRVFTPEAWEADRAAALARRTTGAVAAAAMEAASKAQGMIDEGVGVRERIAESQRLLRDRVTFGKSNIHGWGLIAKTHIKAGTMVVPFRGESVRPSVANLREKAYEASGRDCYLLMADPRTVIDTTAKGNVARFTNHSCNPNMYTKIVSADGASHIIFFTRADVKPGEELTYNYRFDAESGKVPCYCGAYNCRGFLC